MWFLLIYSRSRGFHLVEQCCTQLPPEAQSGIESLSPVKKPRLSDGSLWNKISKEKHDSYRQLLGSERKRIGLDDHSKSQFIAFKNAECAVVNEYCCQVYNRHGVKRLDEKTGRMVMHFERGDKIMCGKNHDATLFATEREARALSGESRETDDTLVHGGGPDEELKEVSHRLMNGSVYIIKDVKLHSVAPPANNAGEESDTSVRGGSENEKISREFFVLDDLGGDDIRPEKTSFLRRGKPSHAWALTIHKFQGSEADTVVYGVSDSGNETWQHVYTAVTRAKKRVIVVGRWEDLEAAVKRSPRRRQTTLDERVVSFLRYGQQRLFFGREIWVYVLNVELIRRKINPIFRTYTV